jgi:hypothetical protein
VAGKSTLNRLELSKPQPGRYHKISHDGGAIEALFVDLFLEARWPQIEDPAVASALSDKDLDEVAKRRVIYFTPTVVNSPGSVRDGLRRAAMRLRDVVGEPTRRVNRAILDAQDAALAAKLERMRTTEDWLQDPPARSDEPLKWPSPSRTHWIEPAELVVIDEADRLRTSSLEEVRDLFDRTGVPVVLVGMPGLEKRLARHAQLYSRVGFVHAYKPLRPDELSRLLDERWPDLAPGLPKNGVVDPDAISAIVRMTAGNLRLVTRLLDQIRRILTLNGLDKIDRGVVDAARESLVIGPA